MRNKSQFIIFLNKKIIAKTKPIPTPESKSVSNTATIVTTITRPFSQSVLNKFYNTVDFN